MADPALILKALKAINERENTAKAPLSALPPGHIGDPDNAWDCDDYARAKFYAEDFPAGVDKSLVDVVLPDGQRHRVVQALIGQDAYLLDNLSGDLVPRQQRERDGWQFTEGPKERLSRLLAEDRAKRQASQGLLGLGNSAAPR